MWVVWITGSVLYQMTESFRFLRRLAASMRFSLILFLGSVGTNFQVEVISNASNALTPLMGLLWPSLSKYLVSLSIPGSLTSHITFL